MELSVNERMSAALFLDGLPGRITHSGSPLADERRSRPPDGTPGDRAARTAPTSERAPREGDCAREQAPRRAEWQYAAQRGSGDVSLRWARGGAWALVYACAYSARCVPPRGKKEKTSLSAARSSDARMPQRLLEDSN